jgi:voltage-gated potassium channel Kch
MYAEKIYKYLEKVLAVFEKPGKKIDQKSHPALHHYDVILIGYAKMGISLVESFKLLGKKYFVIDYDPQVIQDLEKQHIDCLYADISSLDTFNEIDFSSAKMVISTLKDLDTNLLLINTIKKTNPRSILIVLSHQIDEALRLYEQGASYVIMPFHIGGHHTSSMISEYGFDLEKFLIEKNQQISKLLIRKEINKSHSL